ncbi:MAG: hypothetical protein K8F91_20785 [Candidatus Obscuribacterales bacterium]|nr:hypothetical protein [Candidatus Obscuribacterales bacterium]
MTCQRNFGCADPIQAEANDLAQMLDNGRNTGRVADALRADSYNMAPRDFNRLVNEIQYRDRPDRGDNLVIDQAGNLIIDNGSQGFVVATRDFDNQQRYAASQRQQHQPGFSGHQQHGRTEPVYQGQQQRDIVVDGVVHTGIGAVTGAIINGKKGAIAGGVGGLGNVVVDNVGGPNNRDPVTDTVVKGAIGAGIGAIIDGKDGAISGAAGSVVPNVIDRIFNKK